MADTVEKDAKESIARNKRARHDYHIIDTWEAGVVLTGSEVKSLRDGKANISDSYAIVKDGEVFLLNLHISPYEKASYFNHEPTRTRKLLLHRKEIRKMIGAVERQGLTLIPLELYFNGGKRSCLALGKEKALRQAADEKRKATSATCSGRFASDDAFLLALQIAAASCNASRIHFVRDGSTFPCRSRSRALASIRADAQ